MPSSDIASVRGIGVAVSVSTSTSARSRFSCSFCRTPKRCSSSMMTRPRFLNLTSGWISLCVPITRSMVPAARPSSAAFTSFGGAEARQLDELHRQVGEAVGEDLEVLLGEQRRRHQHRDLLAVGERDERRAQRDLGLAEADVAADQPVHRLAARQVLDDRLDRRLLVRRLLEAEALGERLVVVRAEPERVALARRALRVEVEELRRRVVRLPRRALLRLLPLAAAELVQRRRLGRGAAVAADQVQVRHRHVELGVVGVDELQELGRTFAEVQRDEAEIAADAVLLVDDRVADAHLGEVAQHRVDVRAPRGVAPAAAHDAGVELGLGDEGEPRRGHAKPACSGATTSAQRASPATNDAPVVDERHVETVFGEVLLHRLAAAGALGADQHALVARGEEALQRDERIVGAAIDLHRRQRDGGRRRRRRRRVRRASRGARSARAPSATPLNASGGRKTAVGGSSGRALSPRSSL